MGMKIGEKEVKELMMEVAMKMEKKVRHMEMSTAGLDALFDQVQMVEWKINEWNEKEKEWELMMVKKKYEGKSDAEEMAKEAGKMSPKKEKAEGKKKKEKAEGNVTMLVEKIEGKEDAGEKASEVEKMSPSVVEKEQSDKLHEDMCT